MDKSQLKKQLLESQKEVASLFQLFMQRPALIRGSVYKLRRKCGKATCRCQEGHLHESWVLSGYTRKGAQADAHSTQREAAEVAADGR